MVNPGGKDIVVDRAAPPIEPGHQAGPSVCEQFELNRETCFLLHHDCPRSALPALTRSPIFNCTRLQPRSLLSIARSNSARSRKRRR